MSSEEGTVFYGEIYNMFYKVQNVSAEKNETNFTLVFKTKPEFSTKQPKKVNQQI